MGIHCLYQLAGAVQKGFEYVCVIVVVYVGIKVPYAYFLLQYAVVLRFFVPALCLWYLILRPL